MQFLSSAEDLMNIQISQADELDDMDFQVDPQALETNILPSPFKILGVSRVHVYSCCSKLGMV